MFICRVRSSPSHTQAHDEAIYSMVWSHDDRWMVTGDHSGRIKYWQSNMNNVKEFVGHKDPVRDISYVRAALRYAPWHDHEPCELSCRVTVTRPNLNDRV
jgi:WD40 repeat protein